MSAAWRVQGQFTSARNTCALLDVSEIVLKSLRVLSVCTGNDIGMSAAKSQEASLLLYCRAFAKKLNDAPLAIVDKRRSAHNVSEVMNLIGDVRGKVAVLVDDMIDTAGTITNAAKV